MEKPNETKPVIKQSEDYELLLLMSWKEDDEQEARAAFASFYNRHYPYFEAVAAKVCGRLPKEYLERSQIKKALLNNLFKRVYDKAGVILKALEKHSMLDASAFRKKIRAYMGRMATNELNTLLREDLAHNSQIDYKNGEAYYDFISRVAEQVEEEEAEYPPSNMALVAIEKGLESLTERERDVLLTCFRYETPGRCLPDEVIKELCDRWGLLSDYMRLIKYRAFKKLEKKAKEHINQ